MRQKGLEMVRYADDMVVLCREPGQAQDALELIQEWMDEAALTLHPEKTRTVAMIEAGSHFELPAMIRRESGWLSRWRSAPGLSILAKPQGRDQSVCATQEQAALSRQYQTR